MSDAFTSFDDLSDQIGEIVGGEWSLWGMTNLTSSAYMATYDTPEDRTVAEYEFKSVGRAVVDPVEGAKAHGFELTMPEPTLYIRRELQETTPPDNVLVILERAKAWKRISTAHPNVW